MDVELKVTAKGQVTLRKSILEHLGVKPGDRLSVSIRSGGIVALEPLRKKKTIADLAGLLNRPGEPVISVEDMDEVVADAAAERYRRATR